MDLDNILHNPQFVEGLTRLRGLPKDDEQYNCVFNDLLMSLDDVLLQREPKAKFLHEILEDAFFCSVLHQISIDPEEFQKTNPEDYDAFEMRLRSLRITSPQARTMQELKVLNKTNAELLEQVAEKEAVIAELRDVIKMQEESVLKTLKELAVEINDKEETIQELCDVIRVQDDVAMTTLRELEQQKA